MCRSTRKHVRSILHRRPARLQHSHWATRFAGWPAQRKLEYVDRLMRELARRRPVVRSARLVDPLPRLRMTLGRDRVVSVEAAELGEAIAKHPIVFGLGTPPHRLVPAHHLSEVLRALHPNSPL